MIISACPCGEVSTAKALMMRRTAHVERGWREASATGIRLFCANQPINRLFYVWWEGRREFEFPASKSLFLKE